MNPVDNVAIAPTVDRFNVPPTGDALFSGKGKHLGQLKQLLDSSLQGEALKLKDRATAATYNASSIKIDISFEYTATVIEGQVQKSVSNKFNFSLDATLIQAQTGTGQGMPDAFSPENVANRIMNFVEGVFRRYAEGKDFAGKSGEEVKQTINKFIEMAGQAISEGFRDAKAILDNLNNPPGKDVMDKAQLTSDLVSQKLDALGKKLADGVQQPPKEIAPPAPGAQAQQLSLHADFTYERSVSLLQGEVAKSVTEKFHLTLDASFTQLNVPPEKASADHFSPDKVAGRIVNFVEKVFDRHMANKDLSGKTAEEVKTELDNFMKSAQDAVKEGFQQASAIIQGSEEFPKQEVPVKVAEIQSKVLERFKQLYSNLLEKLNTFPKQEDAGVFQYRNAGFRLEVSAEHAKAVLQSDVSRTFSEHFGFSVKASFQGVVENGKELSPEKVAGQFMQFVNKVFDEFSAQNGLSTANGSQQAQGVKDFAITADNATHEAFDHTRSTLGRSKQAHSSPSLRTIDDAHAKVSKEISGLETALMGRVKKEETQEKE